MIFVLDTDILSLLGHRDSPEAPRIRRRIVELPREDLVATTIVNYEEQIRGWMAALSRAKSSLSEIAIYERLQEHLLALRRMTLLPYREDAANIVAKLRSRRVGVGAMDLKIAAITLAHEATLVTRNLADFRRIEGLRIENWSDG